MQSLLLHWQDPWIPASLPALSFFLRGRGTAAQWSAAILCTEAALGLTLLQAAATWRAGMASMFSPERIMLLLILFLAMVILRFSRSYLRGERGERNGISLLAITISSSALVVTAPRLDVLTVAWIVGSISLNGLLQYYPDRRAAQLAAHKNFTVNRLADLCLFGFCALLYRSFGTLDIGSLNVHVGGMTHLPLSLSFAAVLLVAAVCLKTAQVPLHGWLMQVMEAPTPVSALLHAGVVNLGGFVLLRLHPLLDRSLLAQILLTAAGSVTVLVASISSMTRVSIKVRLAWSTCAQMGFLLVECGLGLYPLALLHLVGHSLYKAYAFLQSGSTVEEYRQFTRAGGLTAQPRSPWGVQAVAVATSLLTVWMAYVGLDRIGYRGSASLAAILTVGLGLSPLLASSLTASGARWAAVRRFLTLLALYFCWEGLLTPVLGDARNRPVGLALGFALTLISLFIVQTIVQSAAATPGLMAFRRWAFHGFYLDESFTRIVFLLWPARYQRTSTSARIAANVRKFA
jgi:NAD(P)H-quinone oxidoreductase subunit 5